jgi:hypothetical protein
VVTATSRTALPSDVEPALVVSVRREADVSLAEAQ